MRVLMVALLVCACDGARPTEGDRTILLEIDRPAELATNHHLRQEQCQPCLRAQRPGESLASCGFAADSELWEAFGYGGFFHRAILMCSYEAP